MSHLFRRLGNILLLLGALAALLPAPVLANGQPVDLELDNTSSTTWTINNVKPGDSGEVMVSLRNSGTEPGSLRIWLSDVINGTNLNSNTHIQGGNQSGELGEYIQVSLACSRLVTNLVFPLALDSLPRTPDSPSFVGVSPLYPDDTIGLAWEWELPSNVGNIVQGDSFTFSVNYTLGQYAESPESEQGEGSDPAEPPAPAATPPSVIIFSAASSNTETRVEVEKSGGTSKSCTVLFSDAGLSIYMEKGTEILTTNDEVPERIVVTVSETAPSPPEGFMIVSPVYNIDAYTRDGKSDSATFNPPIQLSLGYDLANLSGGATDIFIAYYDDELGWVQIGDTSDIVALDGKAAAMVSHLTPFAVLAKPANSTQVTKPVQPPIPARIEILSIEMLPKQARVGERVIAKIRLANHGGLNGERNLLLTVDGEIVRSQTITLRPGEEQSVGLSIIAGEPGTHEIAIDGIIKTLIVTKNTPSLIWDNDYFIYNCIIAGCLLALAIAEIFMLRRKRKNLEE